MRGSPLLRAVLVVVALAALAIPLRHLTAHRADAAPTATRTPTPSQRVTLALTSTAGPGEFVIRHLGAVIWQGQCAAGETVRRDVDLSFPAEGVDLALEATWPEGALGAVRLAVMRDGEEAGAHTAWGEGAVDEVFTFTDQP